MHPMRDVILHSGSYEKKIASSASTLVAAIDLGFGNKKKSCGCAYKLPDKPIKKDELQFGQCIKKTSKLLKDCSKAILVIEAPLSGLFSEEGNPIPRGNFEKRASGGNSDRYWYCQSGAAMCLAAIFFLRELRAELEGNPNGQASPIDIELYEGFVTFKEKATDHGHDAEQLLDAFLRCQDRDIDRVIAADGGTVVTVMDVIGGIRRSLSPPPIIIPKLGIALEH